MSNTKFNLKSIFTWLSLFLITAFLFNFSLKEYVFSSDVYIAVMLIIAFLMLTLSNAKTLVSKLRGFKKGDVIFTLITLALIPAFVLIRNGDIANGNFGKPFFSVFALLMLFVLTYAKDTRRPALILTAAFTLEHVFFTWLFYFCPVFYKTHILGLFPDFSHELNYQFNHGQMAGLTMHYSTNAIYLSIGVVVFVACLIRATTKKQRIVNIILSVLTMSALLITGKRGPLVFVVAAVVVMYVACNLKNIKKTLIRLGIILVAAVCIILVLSAFIPSIAEPFNRLFKEKDLTNGRVPMYTLAMDSFKENAVFGIGWGQYKYVYEQSDIKSSQDRMDAHNVYLQLLCEVGVVGTAVFVALFLYMLWQTLRLIYLRAKNGDVSQPLVFSLGIQTYFVLYCITGNPLYDVFAFYPYILGLSYLLGEQKSEKE